MHGDVCIVCAAEEAMVKTRDGFVQCRGNRKFYLPEFIQTDSWASHEDTRNTRLKHEAAKKKKADKKKGKGKGKGKKPKDKAEHYPAKKGKGKYGMNLDDWA
jgi:hypothetical protein